jgi:hypothetical protein
MKTLLYISFVAVFAFACSSSRNTAAYNSAPVEKARDYNFNLNQAKNIVDYTTKHKKARQKISDHNREVQNDNHIKMNASNKHPDTRPMEGQFKFYKNN